MVNRRVLAAVAVTIGLMTSGVMMATTVDLDSAKNYVKEAKDLVERQSYDDAGSKLELAETELDGVDAGAKAAVMSDIAAVKQSITKAKASADVPKYKRKLDRAMTEAEGAIGNLVIWGGAAREAKELFADPAAQAAIPDELAAAKKKFATFEKLNAKKAGVVYKEQCENAMKDLEAKWAEVKPVFSNADSSPNAKESAVVDMQREADRAMRSFRQLGEDSDEFKAYKGKMDEMLAEATKLGLAEKAKEISVRLKDNFDSYKDEWEGWDSEPAIGPTWAEYKKQGSEKMSAFYAPKSKGYISRADNFLKNLEDNSEYKTVAASDDVKAVVSTIKANRDKAHAAMVARINPLVKAAMGQGGDEVGRLKDDVRNALGEDSAEGKELVASIEKKIDDTQKAAAGKETADREWYEKMKAAVEAAWPGIESKFSGSAESGFDPSNPGSFKGKLIKINTDNLMGYRFKPGDFEFATTLNGMPVAGHFDPALKAAIAAVEAKLGRSLGDNDDDGRWDVYAIVTGKTGRMMQKKEGEGDVKVDGQNVGKVTVQYADPVDAPIITIVAAKCGPFVGGKGVGVIKPDATVGK